MTSEVVKILTPEQIARIRAVCKTHERFETESWKILALLGALDKISAIRDGIVGMQGFHWSQHAYPLVAALGDVGYEGAGYESARKNLGTLIDRIEVLEAALREAKRKCGSSYITPETTCDLCDGIDAVLAAPHPMNTAQ